MAEKLINSYDDQDISGGERAWELAKDISIQFLNILLYISTAVAF